MRFSKPVVCLSLKIWYTLTYSPHCYAVLLQERVSPPLSLYTLYIYNFPLLTTLILPVTLMICVNCFCASKKYCILSRDTFYWYYRLHGHCTIHASCLLLGANFSCVSIVGNFRRNYMCGGCPVLLFVNIAACTCSYVCVCICNCVVYV